MIKDARLVRDDTLEAEPSLPAPPPAYLARELTQGGVRAHIVHGDQVYTLSITRAGKLILTK